MATKNYKDGISVIVTVYNKEKYILHTLSSVMPQLNKFDQIIIVDDGSTDKSLSLIKKKIKNKKIIIIGDILFEETNYLLSFVNKITSELEKYKIFFKPHPTMTKKSILNLIEKYNYINITHVNSDRFKDFEFAICSNGTSANLDCLIQNINFCSVKPYNSLNLYPVDRYQKYYQVGSPSELIKRIKNPKKNTNKFFFETTQSLSKFEKFF